ncbi:MAG: Na/Pi cotransporter family protein [Lachnospiraceae bacterium]|nr:Na/Pi cotransporter family protein [Lachnospiraceae bacterium]
MSLSVVISLCGGLGLFLYGMKSMSKAIETVAGAKLRHILEIFTTNRFSGLLVGIIFTVATQSSSACTAMVVSFVNAGLMNLTQAAGVIFGANIGTTVTSQLVSLNFSKYAPLILLTGVVMPMISKKEKVIHISDIITGFGILFLGLSTMSAAVSVLKTDEAVQEFLASLTNPFIALMVGLLLTATIQSSSVIVSIVILLAQQDLLSLPICLYLVLGTSIGGCSTSLLASLSGKKDAKRTAMIHLWFNVFGTIVVFILFLLFMDPIISFLQMLSSGNGRFVANAHLFIKITQVIVLFPFLKQLVWLSEKSIRGEDVKIGYRENFQLEYIGNKVVFNPATAVVDVIKEIDRMASLASENLNRAMNALITLDEEDIEEVYQVEKNINFLNHSITGYLVKINQSTLPIEDLKSLGALFHVVNDIERIGDHAENVADAARQRKESGTELSKTAQRELGQMLDKVNLLIRYSIEMFVKSDESHMQEVIKLEESVDEMEKELQANHITRLTNGECSPEAGMIFSDIVSGLERVGDHATNIAFAIHEDNEQVDPDKPEDR